MSPATGMMVNILMFVVLFMGLLVLPFLVVRDYYKVTPAGKRFVAIWLFIFFWPLGSYAYSFFGKTGNKKRNSIFSVASILLLVVGFFSLTRLVSGSYQMAIAQIEWLKVQLPRVASTDLSSREIEELARNLNEMKSEVRSLPWDAMDQKLIRLNLTEILSQMILDGHLSRQEFDYWKGAFGGRNGSGQSGQTRVEHTLEAYHRHFAENPQ